LKVRILTVGEPRQDFYAAACREYRKRLQAYARVEMKAVKAEPLRGNLSEAEEKRAVDAEGERLLTQLTSTAYNVALDARGKQYTSRKLAQHLNRQLVSGRSDWTFVIGGPLGLSRQVLRECHLILSLSRLTFPHELVPVVILEQLYRSFKIIRGEPYHR